MTPDQIPEAFALFGQEVARAASVQGAKRRLEGTMHLAAALGVVLAPACPELRTGAGRALLEVVAAQLSEMLGATWQRGYDLGKLAAAPASPAAAP